MNLPGMLYVCEQGMYLHQVGERIQGRVDGKSRFEVKMKDIDGVVIYGNIQFSTQLLKELLLLGKNLAMLTMSGRLCGTLMPPEGKNINLRLKQYALHADEHYCDSFARQIAGAKISNALRYARSYNRRRKLNGYYDFLARGNNSLIKLMTAEVATMRGLEGTNAAGWFNLLREIIPPSYAFNGRDRRPPQDPVNSMLSFGYSLLESEISALLEASGLDPYPGFYHTDSYGRHSLACDVMEEFRVAVVDRLVIDITTHGIIKPHDFVDAGESGCRMKQEVMREYIRRYEKHLNAPLALKEEVCLRNILWRQIERLRKAISESDEYRPFEYGDIHDDDHSDV